jgi:hypothetical protein
MALRVFRVLRVLLGCLMFPARLGLPARRVWRVLSARLGLRVPLLALRAQPGQRAQLAPRGLPDPRAPRVMSGLRERTASRASRASRDLLDSAFGTRAKLPRSRSCPPQAMWVETFGSSATGTTIQSLPIPMCGMKISRTGCMRARFRACRVSRAFRDQSARRDLPGLTEPRDPLAPRVIPAIRVLPVTLPVLLVPRDLLGLLERTAPLGLLARRATLAPPGLKATPANRVLLV